MNTNTETKCEETQTLAEKAEEAKILLQMQDEADGAELAKW